MAGTTPHQAGANAVRLRATKRITWLGLTVNVALTVFKFAIGWLGHSQAIVADAAHSLSDLVTDIAVLLGVPYWTAPADAHHPYGHSRIETIVTAFIGCALGAVGIGIALDAVLTMPTRHGAPQWYAALGALVSIIVKEALYHVTVHVGRRINSPAVIANAWHHRSDAFSSMPALLAVLVAVLRPAWAFVDHLGAVIVALFIIKMAWTILLPALSELVDCGATQADTLQIEALALAVAGVRTVHNVRARRMSGELFVDLHVQVDGQISVAAGHAIAGAVKAALLRGGPRVRDVIVHIEPYTAAG